MVRSIIIGNLMSLAERLGWPMPAGPSFEGLLDDLFATWPHDAWELREVTGLSLASASRPEASAWDRLGRLDPQREALRLSSI